MSFQRFSVVGLITLAVTLSCSLLFAKDGRDFAGLYSLSATGESADREAVTMRLQVFNYSGEDVQNATIVLRENHPGGQVLAKSDVLPEWRNGRHTVIEQSFSIPKREYEQWLRGAQPNLLVIYVDSAGEQRQRTAQIRISPQGSF